MNATSNSRPHTGAGSATVIDLAAYRRKATYYAMASIARGRRAHPSWDENAAHEEREGHSCAVTVVEKRR